MIEKKEKILVIGSANTDMVTNVPRIPAPGETVLGEAFMMAQGGKGANQAVAAARAGGDVTFIACLGNDHFASQAVENYKNDQINVDHIFYDTQVPSGVALIFVAQNGENSIAVASGANARLTAQNLLEKKRVIQQAQVLILQLETPLSTVTQAIDIAHDARVPVILNPAPAQKLSAELLSKITILTPNQSEAEMLTGIKINDDNSAQQAAQKLLDQGVQNVIVTLGEKGALIAQRNSPMEFVKGYKVHAVDTTGAGDTFNGAFAVAYSEGKSLVEAVQFANAAAALAVSCRGAQPSIPKRDQIIALCHKTNS